MRSREGLEDMVEKYLARQGKSLPPIPRSTATLDGVPLDVLRRRNEAEAAERQVTTASTEDELAEAIDKRLEAEGYIVIVCDNGGHRLNTTGCPDRYVALPGCNRWVALELKRPKGGHVRPGQKRLLGEGVSVLVRSVAEALEAAAALRE